MSVLSSKNGLRSINHQNYKELESILRKYPKLLTEYNKDIKIDQYIIQSFKEKKTLNLEDYKSVEQFCEELEEFFYVIYASYDLEPNLRGLFDGEVFVTRVKKAYNIVKCLIDKEFEKHNGILGQGFIDKYTRTFGILFGYSLQEVTQYCKKRRKFKLLLARLSFLNILF